MKSNVKWLHTYIKCLVLYVCCSNSITNDMNSLEAEYSFLAPTWKLPTVATTSMYSRLMVLHIHLNTLDSGPDWVSEKTNKKTIDFSYFFCFLLSQGIME